MPYTRKQKRVAYHLFDVGRKMGKSRKDILSALETGLVEANLGNPDGGDRDSVGWRQERSHYGSKGRRKNVRGGAKRFYKELEGAGKGTPGQRAQAVQRSAFPGRYDEREGQARDLLNWLEKTHGKGGSDSGSGSRYERVKTKDAVDNSANRQALRQQAFDQGRPFALKTQLAIAAQDQELQDSPAEYERRKVKGDSGSGGGKGTTGDRTDIERIAALAKSMGLRVSGNQGVQGHPETSGHTANSNHYARAQTRRGKGKWQGALDISGDPRKMAKLAEYLSRRKGRDLEELIYRGPGSKNRHNIKRGKRVGKGFYSAHEDHVHVADLDR